MRQKLRQLGLEAEEGREGSRRNNRLYWGLSEAVHFHLWDLK